MIGWPAGRQTNYYSPLAHNFVGLPTADLGVSDTGQAWWMVENDISARLSVISGKLTNASSAAAVRAGYIEAHLGANVASITANFVLGAGNAGGVATLVVWKWMLQTTANIPDAACHLTVGKSNWNYGVWQSGGLTSLASGSLALTADGATVYTATVSFSGTTATITLPDGGHSATDARIASLLGPWACFEAYQGDASVDGKPKFTSVGAT